MFFLLIFPVLALLVLTHEFGHFIVARKNGIKVDEFGFGFPPRIVGIRLLKKHSSVHAAEQKGSTQRPWGTVRLGKWTWQVVWGREKEKHRVDETDWEQGVLYSFNLLPLGGFVKIKGEDSADPHAKDPDSFASKKAWQKTSVLVAGVLMNVITAAVLLSIGFMIGLPAAGNGSDTDDKIQGRKLEVAQVLPGKPAEAVGIQVGDAIVEVDAIENPTFKDFQEYINSHRDQAVTITVQRGEERITKTIKPIVYEDTNRGGIGVGLAELGFVKYPWHQAVYHGVLSTGTQIKQIFAGFGFLIKAIFTDAKASEAVSGPVGIAIMTGQIARLGWMHLLQFTAFLSLNLAVLNILPIPALDGGRLLFVIIGKILRRPVTPRLEQLTHFIGFALLMVLVVTITIKDIHTFRGMFVEFFQRVF